MARLTLRNDSTSSAVAQCSAVRVGVMQGDRSNGYVERHRSWGNQANRPAVWATRNGFQFINHLHGTNLWRASDGARRECGAQHFNHAYVGAKDRFNFCNAVMHRLMALHFARCSHAYAARKSDAPKVVAHQIHNHVQLGSIFAAGQQFAWILVKCAGSLDGAGDCTACHAINFNKQFWAHTHQRVCSGFQIRAVARPGGVHSGLQNGTRRSLPVCRKSLRNVCLKDVTCVNEFHRARNH